MKKFSGLIVLFIAFILLQSCVSTPKKVLSKAEKATFIIYTFDEFGTPSGIGSGFFIDKEGHGITNYHVLKGSTKAIVRMADSTEYEISKVDFADQNWDIVQFSIKNPKEQKLSYLNISNKTIETGDQVFNLAAPRGFAQTFSDGLISSIREDSHGKVVQVTLPISPGSSGSPIMNSSGDVIAVTTYQYTNGQNLNFGVCINKERLSNLQKQDSKKVLSKDFPLNGDKGDLVIINRPADAGDDLVLNALEFKKDATIAYLTYSNFDMTMSSSVIWCAIGEKDNGFYIRDNKNVKHYIISSTIGKSHSLGTSVDLANICKFKIYFPAIQKDAISRIDLCEGNNNRWSFTNLDITKYKENINIDWLNCRIEYACASLNSHDAETSLSLFNDILEQDPQNLKVLNAMGIISYLLDNNLSALSYFTTAIEEHPTSLSSYLNRFEVYRSLEEYDKALNDIGQVLSIGGEKQEYLIERSDIYFKQKDYGSAISDLNKAFSLSVDDSYKFRLYNSRACCYLGLDDVNAAMKDFKKALSYTNSPEQRERVNSMISILGGRLSGSDEGILLEGSVGKFPITMYLCFYGEDKVGGWYYYNQYGYDNKMILVGGFDEGRLVMFEYDGSGEMKDYFSGYYSYGSYSGTFYASRTSKTYQFKVS